jgi:hypothetical protein
MHLQPQIAVWIAKYHVVFTTLCNSLAGLNKTKLKHCFDQRYFVGAAASWHGGEAYL